MATSVPLNAWLARAAAGDRSVLPDLLEKCRAEMVARLRNRPHATEAKDLVQDAGVKTCQRQNQSKQRTMTAAVQDGG
jgi:hypothetical protein